MDFSFSPDISMLQDMLRKFIEKEVRPLENKYFINGKLEPAENKRLRTHLEQMGLWGITIPANYGGGELDLLTSCVIEEELGKTFIPLDIGEIPPMLFACQGEQVKRYLKPVIEGERRVFLAGREEGSLFPKGWSTSASELAEGYCLRGIKQISTIPGANDFFVVFAKSEPGITAFLLDADRGDIEVNRNGHTNLILKNCAVSKEAVLGEFGQALTLGQKEAPRNWIRIAARYVGLVSRLLEMSVNYASNWVALGKPLIERPGLREMLAELQVQLECCRWLVIHAAWLADQGQQLQLKSAQVRLASGALLQKAIDFTTLIFGGPGPSDQTELHKYVLSVLPQEVMKMTLETAAETIASQIIAST